MPLSCFTSATQLVHALRQREISAVETLQLFLDQYQRHHASVNAICTLASDAMDAAVAADEAAARGEWLGPLHGLPVSFKDSHATAGTKTTCGFPPLREFVPDRDATVVALMRAAGGIPFAKTNVPLLLSGFHTDNEIFGRTNNPWNLACTAGGSSGGSAAALAAGMAPLDIGSDMFGSIRVPAHFCGVAGFKPTQFRISRVGHYPPLEGWPFAGNILAVSGPMSRSVEDLLLSFPVLAVADPLEAESSPMPLEDSPVKPASAYRLAWTDDFAGVPVSRETREALARTARLMEKAGMRVEKISPDWDLDQIWRAAGEICTGTLCFPMSQAERAAWADSLQADANNGPLQAGSYQGILGRLDDWCRALEVRRGLIVKLRTFFEQWDGWLVPTTSVPAFRHEEYKKPLAVDGVMLPAFTATGSFVTPFNLSGSPAVTLPLGMSEAGLPIGLQLVGAMWKDMPLLRLAHLIEDLAGAPTVPPGYAP